MHSSHNTTKPHRASLRHLTYTPVNLPITRYRLHFSTPAASYRKAQLQENLDQINSTDIWRGVLGKCLIEHQSPNRDSSSDSTDAIAKSLFSRLFDSRPTKSDHIFSNLKNIPHPYVLRTCGFEENNQILSGYTYLSIFGDCAGSDRLSVLTALVRAAKNGIGSNRISLSCSSVEVFERGSVWSETSTHEISQSAHHYSAGHPPEFNKPLLLTFQTPLNLRSNGKSLTPATLKAEHVLMAALRRVSSLAKFYGEPIPLEKESFSHLKSIASQCRVVSKQLEMQNHSRWSARQARRHPLNGVVGNVTLEGKEIELFWPYLWLCSTIHIGKNTTMGLGYMQIAAT